ncbi:MAG: galactokinase [Bacteroidetes bacterium]|nr:galactokinase [Bacteroidota bacterium]
MNDKFQIFKNQYGENAELSFFAPGRINLIGEHIDYNGGNVLPCTLNFGTLLLVRKTNDNIISFSSTNYSYTQSININDIKSSYKEWVKYPIGVIAEFIRLGFPICGMDLLFSGDIPIGSGLSSSASIELVTAVALNEILDSKLSMINLIKLSQKAENNFVGVNCGIMDQFAIGMGEKDCAILLNCNTLAYRKIPINTGKYKLIISDTNKPRKLIESKYNERREECEKAFEIISSVKNIHYLCDLSFTELLNLKYLFTDNILWKRVSHVVSENERVDSASSALESGDLEKFGRLMNKSHDSLKLDYDVTGKELDVLVEEARKIDGVLGSRMTGAGFGGCTISLVNENNIKKFIDVVGKNYKKRIGLEAKFYTVNIGDGAKRI